MLPSHRYLYGSGDVLAVIAALGTGPLLSEASKWIDSNYQKTKSRPDRCESRALHH